MIRYNFKTLKHVILCWEAIRDTLERNANAMKVGQGFLFVHEQGELMELLGDLAKFIDAKNKVEVVDAEVKI